jgi:hypothetical protein
MYTYKILNICHIVAYAGGRTCTGVKRTLLVLGLFSGYGPGSGGRYASATMG